MAKQKAPAKKVGGATAKKPAAAKKSRPAKAPRAATPVAFAAPAGESEHPSECTCVAHFLSPLMRRSLPPEFADQLRAQGLDVHGPVTAGRFPGGFVFGPADSTLSFGVVKPTARWEAGDLPLRVGFLDRNPPVEKKVRQYVKEWEEAAGIQFKFVTDPASAHIRITFAQPGNFSSLLGREAEGAPPNRETMSLGFTGSEPESEYSRLILHEFGHALGFAHEHQNPKDGIQFDPPKAIAYYAARLPRGMPEQEIWAQLKAVPNSSMYKFSPFDGKSIMLYATPEHIVKPGAYRPEFGNNNTTLSETDRRMAAELYGKKTGPVEPRELKVGGPDASDSITADGEVDRFKFAVPTRGVYRVETDGDAIVHVDILDEREKPLPGFEDGSDSLSPARGVRMPCLLKAGAYVLHVRASGFLPGTRGEYTIRVAAE